MEKSLFTMKATALLVCFLALASAGQNGQQADHEKQQNLTQLFVNVQQHNYNQEQNQFGEAFDFSNANNFNNVHAVRQFQNAYNQGMLPRGHVFNYYNPNHLQQAIQLFDLFYFAKDYNTFYQAACWARNHVNEGQFVYALSVAIAKRQDIQNVALPPQSEVYPNLYVHTQAVQQAQNHKQQGQKQANFQSNHTCNYAHNHQQMYQQQQQQQQMQQQGNQNQFPFSNEYQNQYDMENQANQYQNQNQYNYEGRVAYFCEDVNMNQQFAMQQIYNPNWFNSQKYGQKNQNQNGENFYYYLQQVLARYNMERHAHHMSNVQPFQFNQNMQPGYNPQLQYHNGQAVPARPDNMDANNANANYMQQAQTMDMRFADAVDSHQVINDKGDKQALNSENGVETLSNMMQANEQSINNQYYAAYNGFYGYFDMLRKMVGSMVDPNNQQNAPGAMETDGAAMRDPIFYQITSRIVNYFQNFKNQMKPYNQEQLNFQGVQVQAVNVDDMYTYFDNNEVDMFNAINYQKGEMAEHFQYNAYQQQLNHKSFNYKIQVQSEKNAEAMVRVFMGPQFDVQGHQYSMEQARQHFVEIDRFVAHLKSGQNEIQRSSEQSNMFVQQQPGSRDLYNQAKQGNMNYNQTMQQQQMFCMPQNMMVPMGSQHGQQYVFAVAVHEYQPNQHSQDQQQHQCQPNDNHAQGFPFDRTVQPKHFQQANNIFFQTATVYHQNQTQVNNKQHHH